MFVKINMKSKHFYANVLPANHSRVWYLSKIFIMKDIACTVPVQPHTGLGCLVKDKLVIHKKHGGPLLIKIYTDFIFCGFVYSIINNTHVRVSQREIV